MKGNLSTKSNYLVCLLPAKIVLLLHLLPLIYPAFSLHSHSSVINAPRCTLDTINTSIVIVFAVRHCAAAWALTLNSHKLSQKKKITSTAYKVFRAIYRELTAPYYVHPTHTLIASSRLSPRVRLDATFPSLHSGRGEQRLLPTPSLPAAAWTTAWSMPPTFGRYALHYYSSTMRLE